MTEVDVSPVRLMHFTVGWPVAVRGQRQVTLRGRPSPWPEQSITQHRHFSFPSGHSLSACYSSGDTAMLSFLLYPTKSVTPISVSGALLFFFFFLDMLLRVAFFVVTSVHLVSGKSACRFVPLPHTADSSALLATVTGSRAQTGLHRGFWLTFFPLGHF